MVNAKFSRHFIFQEYERGPMTGSYPSKITLSVLLLTLLGACASEPKTVSTSLQAEPVAVEEPPVAAEGQVEVAQPPESAPASAISPSPWSHEDVVWIQQRLKALGYYSGTVDGSAGQQTRNAIEAYQQDQGVTPDGKPTAELREFMWRNGG